MILPKFPTASNEMEFDEMFLLVAKHTYIPCDTIDIKCLLISLDLGAELCCLLSIHNFAYWHSLTSDQSSVSCFLSFPYAPPPRHIIHAILGV